MAYSIRMRYASSLFLSIAADEWNHLALLQWFLWLRSFFSLCNLFALKWFCRCCCCWTACLVANFVSEFLMFVRCQCVKDRGHVKSKWHPNIENKSKVQIHTSGINTNRAATMIHMSMQSEAWRCALKLYTYHELLFYYYCYYYRERASAPAWINSHSIVMISTCVGGYLPNFNVRMQCHLWCCCLYHYFAEMLPMYRHHTMCT